MEDSEIVELYWRREQRAIAATEEKYGAFLRKLAWGLLRDREDGGECVNDTYLAAWNAMPPTRPALLRAFLAKLTRSLAVDRLRRRTAAKRGGGETEAALSELGECVSGQAGPEERLELLELGECVSRWLDGQRREVRVLFVRRYFYGDDLKTAAQMSGMGLKQAKSALHRARLGLRERLEKEGYEP